MKLIPKYTKLKNTILMRTMTTNNDDWRLSPLQAQRNQSKEFIYFLVPWIWKDYKFIVNKKFA